MPYRTRGWVWAGRAVALAVVTGLAAYLIAVGTSRAAEVAGPAGLVIALATLLAPYLLPAYQPPASAPEPMSADPAVPGSGGVVIIADHGSVAAQNIGEVTMNAPRPDPGTKAGP